MDLPAGPFAELGQQAIEIVGSLLRALVGADVAGVQSVPDRQEENRSKTEKGQAGGASLLKLFI